MATGDTLVADIPLDQVVDMVTSVLEEYDSTLSSVGLSEEHRSHLDKQVTTMREFDRNFPGHFEYEENWGKHLPYSRDWYTVQKMQDMGYRLYRDPTVHNAIEVMISYVINRGWSYTVTERQDGPSPKNGQLRKARGTLERMLETASLGTGRSWYLIQEETYRRLLRDGEFFRRWFIRSGVVHCRFLEVQHVCQPSRLEDVENADQIPAAVIQAARVQGHDPVPGLHGIVVNPDDDAHELGYFWDTGKVRSDGTPVFRYLTSSRVQHVKVNVDANDPRGVPVFYAAGCWVNYLNQVVTAAAELAVTQSNYAVVHKPRAGVRRENLRARVAERARELNRQVSKGNSQNEQWAHNTEVELHGMKVNARNYVEVVQQLQRLIGSIRQIPEFMITNDANTGNRSSLSSAEGPFARRVAREQQLLWYADLELLQESLWRLLGYTPLAIRDAEASMKISPRTPTAEHKDPSRESQAISLALRDRRISPQEAARRTNADPHQMAREWREWQEEEGPLPVEPNSNGAA